MMQNKTTHVFRVLLFIGLLQDSHSLNPHNNPGGRHYLPYFASENQGPGYSAA
jgi:hypothetical protein